MGGLLLEVGKGQAPTCEEDADEEAPADVVEDLVPHAAAAFVAALRHVQDRVPPHHLLTQCHLSSCDLKHHMALLASHTIPT